MTLTPKQEAFCLAYVETGNASEAYRRAYDSAQMQPATINRKAAEMLANGKIRATLSELREKAVSKTLLTVQAHLHELQVLRDLAKENGQYSAAIKAEELRGKLCRLYDEPKDVPSKEKAQAPNEDAHADHLADITQRFLTARKIYEASGTRGVAAAP
jgi:phage terminase small subunit